ncbi:MAG: alpha/beta fold hydrolase, partial [Nitrosopumilus sp.]
MKQKSTFMGLIAILSLTMALTPTLIDDASAMKSAGNPLLKYGSATDNIVCGGILCSEVNTITVAEKTIKIEGLDVFYLEAGPSDAPTVLLLHGFPTSSHMFRNLVPELADEFHVIAPDMIGYGR